MRHALQTIAGVWELLRLAVKTRCKLRGRYWRWRYETAFGSDPSRTTTRRQRIAAMLEYGRWVHRMRRNRR